METCKSRGELNGDWEKRRRAGYERTAKAREKKEIECHGEGKGPMLRGRGWRLISSEFGSGHGQGEHSKRSG